MKNFFASTSFVQNDAYDGGNDFAGFFNRHGVADADVFFADVILVVQRCAADGAAREKNGFEFGHGRERAGAPDLES